MNRIKTLPQPAQIALVAVGALLILVLGYMVLLAPKQKQISSLQQQTSAAQAQIAEDLQRSAEATGDTGASAIKVADIYKLQTAMPSLPDTPDLLLELDQIAKAAGVTLQSIGFSGLAASADGTYSEIPISIQATGNFYTLTDFVYRLRNLVYVRAGALEANGRIFSVSSLGLTPGDKTLSAAITLDTYVYGTTNGTAVPGSTSTTPTETTTTSTTTTPTTTAGATG
ncbi:MAG TPA: type 4a pilus biogenesis protein PilO [Gaiellaceae bacterium]|nr:type 4a pilus biogenesis protein PilO [Gaiellaceae bacterium]